MAGRVAGSSRGSGGNWCGDTDSGRGTGMDGDTHQPLTTDEAKARLRIAAEQASPTAWLKRHPRHALALALLGGFVAGRVRASSIDGLLAAQKLLVPLILGAAAKRK
jgi:hypothetical protein